MPDPRVLLIGWDAADWKVIQPLLAAGQMPNLARLMAQGVHGNLATIYPVLSPMLWTSIATGKRAFKHGIHGFTEPLPDGSGVRPITLLARKTKAVWNILNQTGRRSVVVGWWPSHPAEPINGAMVSNFFQPPMVKLGSDAPLPAGAVHPPSLAASLGDLRVNPMELSGEFLRLFVPDYEKVPQAKDKRLHTLAKIIADTMSIHAAATELLAAQPWDFAAVYYSGIDHFQHAFMSWHPPRLPWVTEEDFAIYQHVVANAYRYHDAMLGALLGLADETMTVILMSDHGFHPDHLRPGYIPAEPAGPAIEHRHFGILCLKGPALRVNDRLFGAGVLDICPTVLTLFGLPPGKDMDGKVLLTAFQEPPQVEPIPSWDSVTGDDGTHSPETRLDPVASAQAFQQLVDLGYVAPPGADVQETVDECVRELKYNLARAYRDANFCGEAAALAQELWARWPKEHRFGILLVDCLGPLRQTAQRQAAIDELGHRIEHYQAEAQAELARREALKAGQQEDPIPVEDRKTRAQFEERQLRELAYGRPLLIEWFRVSQALLEKHPAQARRCLDKLMQAERLNHGVNQRVAGALAELGDLEAARTLLETALEFDPENPLVLGQLSAIHFKAERYDEAIAAATESLSLLYFQPGLHALLGHALMETKRCVEAEQTLLVAVAQSPRNLAAHDLLARLYRLHLDRPAEAFAHEGKARSLRIELAAQQQAGAQSVPPWRITPLRQGFPLHQGCRGQDDGQANHASPISEHGTRNTEHAPVIAPRATARQATQPSRRLVAPKADEGGSPAKADHAPVAPKSDKGRSPITHHASRITPLGQGYGGQAHRAFPPPPPFAPPVDARQVITVVSGLPRSGTSMMMQLLVAGGRAALADGQRAPDSDNPLGYFEFEKSPGLAKDTSWLPEARGKVVKIVAQLLPFLPAGEHYQIVFMERDLGEVIASQLAMLERQGRRGAELDGQQLADTYTAQLERVRSQLAHRAEVRVLTVSYSELLADPLAGVERLARFLGSPFDCTAAAAAVHPNLRRQTG